MCHSNNQFHCSEVFACFINQSINQSNFICIAHIHLWNLCLFKRLQLNVFFWIGQGWRHYSKTVLCAFIKPIKSVATGVFWFSLSADALLNMLCQKLYYTITILFVKIIKLTGQDRIYHPSAYKDSNSYIDILSSLYKCPWARKWTATGETMTVSVCLQWQYKLYGHSALFCLP